MTAGHKGMAVLFPIQWAFSMDAVIPSALYYIIMLYSALTAAVILLTCILGIISREMALDGAVVVMIAFSMAVCVYAFSFTARLPESQPGILKKRKQIERLILLHAIILLSNPPNYDGQEMQQQR
ncbi:hypothetical protein THASP1DRAFT_26212 [Thamnocephalis sphaerospora]|uniref:Uncharacterized protein n=1 Tax=Thamnocephalis sphaerospora TaxID=78915 RepID=A0A4P9XHT5_9FUNG|nr:hypothetical protein THASP1DRAFT_26212 [Thamnocephalis sphaerospora]|eukprot:RKP05263.1 hypothetical protein THASP1DRAFT_26212 [Thamnocephalis sphaerospora]